MKIWFYVLPAVLYIPVGIYLYYFMKRLLSLFHPDKKGKKTKIIAILFSLLCVAAGWRVYGVGAVIILSFVICSLLADGIQQIVKRILKKRGGAGRWDVIYKSGIIPVFVVSLFFVYGYINIHQVQETVYTIHSEKVSAEGFRIAQISDLHMGTTMDTEELRGYCETIRRQEPDIVFLTGDIFDEQTDKSMMEQAAAVLGSMDAAYGVYYVWGNHDPNLYVADPAYNRDQLRSVLINNRIRVLENEAVQITPQLAVIGRVDLSLDRNRKSVGELMAGLNPDSYRIVLDHRPVELEENAKAGVDLQLSGHTHAGQIWPTGQLAELLGINEMNYGLKTIGDFHAIVSSGMAGWGYAVRTGGNSEYVIIDVLP